TRTHPVKYLFLLKKNCDMWLSMTMRNKPSVLIHVGTLRNFGDQMMLVATAKAICQLMPDVSISLSAGTRAAFTSAQIIQMARQAGVTCAVHTDYFFTPSLADKVKQAIRDMIRDARRMRVKNVFVN